MNINLLDFRDQLDFRANKKLFDPIRKKEVVVTPEELVRQLVIKYLITIKDYPINSISVEKQVVVNGRLKRFDALIYAKTGMPLVLIECKAPSVRLDGAVFFQASQYNLALQADYLIMTNGVTTQCAFIDREEQRVKFLDEMPNFKEL